MNKVEIGTLPPLMGVMLCGLRLSSPIHVSQCIGSLETFQDKDGRVASQKTCFQVSNVHKCLLIIC